MVHDTLLFNGIAVIIYTRYFHKHDIADWSISLI